MNARALAERLGLRPAGREWRGACPACGYASAAVLSLSREGRPLLWCASCRDRDALATVLRGEGCVTPPGPSPADRPSGAGREAQARALWAQALPGHPMVALYLAARGLPDRVPDDLRLLPSLRHAPSGTSGPCMVAALRDAEGEVRAIHRTWLAPGGTGKADLDPARMTLGSPTGCAVRLAPATDAVILAEGIETALAATVLFDLPAWACISAGGLEAVILPDRIRAVLIAADHDANGCGQRAGARLADRLLAEGRRVRIATPDTPGTDFNDVLRAREVTHG